MGITALKESILIEIQQYLITAGMSSCLVVVLLLKLLTLGQTVSNSNGDQRLGQLSRTETGNPVGNRVFISRQLALCLTFLTP